MVWSMFDDQGLETPCVISNQQILSNIGANRRENNHVWAIDHNGRRLEWSDEDDWIKITEPE